MKGRTGAAYGNWLADRGKAFTDGIRTATLDSFHGYANAIRDELPEAITVLDAFPSCSIPEVARLGRPLRRCKAAILAYFDTTGASSGPTEAVNGVIETIRRVARGFRNFENYRLRALLAADGHRPWRKIPTHTQA